MNAETAQRVSNEILILWGKTEKGNPDNYHPLLYHMLDTMNVAREIWENIVPEPVKKKVASQLGISDIEKTGKVVTFLAGCHDIGKATPGFQGLIPCHSERLAVHDLKTTSYDTRHDALSGELLQKLLPNIELRDVFLFSQAWHHGTIVTSDSLNNVTKRELGTGKWEELQKELIEKIARYADVDIKEINNTPTEVSSLIVILAGLTSVSDWIASSENNYSPDRNSNIDEYQETSKKKAKLALENMHWTYTCEKSAVPFSTLFSEIKMPNSLQRTIIEMEKNTTSPSLVIIEAPMGMGKTEAAFYLQKQFEAKFGNCGAYIAMPTMATANQMFTRMKKYLAKSQPGNTINLHLLHGNAMFSKEFQQLKTNCVNPLKNGSDDVVADEWFSYKKRGLLSPFGVGTIDQALLSVLPTKHFFVRLFGLAGKTVIFDEVHAYDVYMTTLLDNVITWLRALGSSVILLSATLPNVKRNELLRAYGFSQGDAADGYPLISVLSNDGKYLSKSIPPQELELGPGKRSIGLEWWAESELISNIGKRIINGGRCAVVCNTVKKAQELYQNLEREYSGTDVEVDLFHARFPFKDRENAENKCIKDFGKTERDVLKKQILIATQVIEQSLDLDFDLLITQPAPVDLILQRSGRLQRHERPRPKGLEKPTLVIIEPENGENDIPKFGDDEKIYSQSTLLRSYIVLKKQKKLEYPKDINTLVNLVYSDADVDASEAYQKKIKECLEKEKTARQISTNKAENRMVFSPSEAWPWMNAKFCLVEDDASVHPDLQAVTREEGPHVSCICLFETPATISFDPDGKDSIDINQSVQNKETIEKLLKRLVNISHPGVVNALKKHPAPEKWKDTASLRGYKHLLFKKTDCPEIHTGQTYSAECGKYSILLNDKNGISYKKVK